MKRNIEVPLQARLATLLLEELILWLGINLLQVNTMCQYDGREDHGADRCDYRELRDK